MTPLRAAELLEPPPIPITAAPNLRQIWLAPVPILLLGHFYEEA